MQDAINGLNVLDFTIVSLGWVKHASGDELRAPSLLFLGLNFGNKLSVGVGFLFLLKIGYNVYNLEGLL